MLAVDCAPYVYPSRCRLTENHSQNRRWQTLRMLGPVLVCLVFVSAVLSYLQLCYRVNDNIGIIDFATAGYPIPYVGILFSSALHQAYSSAPAVAWLGVSLYALNMLALSLWVMLVWRVFSPWWLAAVGTLVVFGYYLALLVWLDFTATSVMLCMVAVAWACVEVVERRSGILRLLLPGCVFALGMLVRPEGVYGALAYSFPLATIAAVTCLRGRPAAPEARRLCLAALLFLAPAILNFGVDAAWREAIRTPQEAQYEAFNAAGGRLMHLSPARLYAIHRDRSLLASVHWVERDFYYFQRWKFLDERIYTPQAMQALVQHAPPADRSYSSLKPLILERLPPDNIGFLLLAGAVPLFAYLLWRRRVEGGIGLLVPVYWVMLTAFMYLMYAFRDRLELPYEIGLGFSSLLMAGLLAQQAGSRIFVPVACLGLAIVIVGEVISIEDVLGSQQHLVKNADQMEDRVQALNADFAGDVILVEPNSLNLNDLSPLRPLELRFRPIYQGWNTFSPRFYQQISPLGIQHGYQLVDALIDKPHAYLFGPFRWCRSLLTYATDSEKRSIQVVPVGGDMCRYSEKQQGTKR